MILSADTNLFLYAANPDSPHNEAAQRFLVEDASGNQRLLLCGLVLLGGENVRRVESMTKVVGSKCNARGHIPACRKGMSPLF